MHLPAGLLYDIAVGIQWNISKPSSLTLAFFHGEQSAQTLTSVHSFSIYLQLFPPCFAFHITRPHPNMKLHVGAKIVWNEFTIAL